MIEISDKKALFGTLAISSIGRIVHILNYPNDIVRDSLSQVFQVLYPFGEMDEV